MKERDLGSSQELSVKIAGKISPSVFLPGSSSAVTTPAVGKFQTVSTLYFSLQL